MKNKSRVLNTHNNQIFYFDSLGESLLFFYSLVKEDSLSLDRLYVQIWDDSQEEGEKWVSPEYFRGDLWKKD